MKKTESVEITRRLIVDSTVKLLKKKNIHSIRVNDVAKRAHVAVPTVYYHFKSLSVVIAEAVVIIMQEYLKPFDEARGVMERGLKRNDREMFEAGLQRFLARSWTLDNLSQVQRLAPLIAHFRHATEDDVRMRKLQSDQLRDLVSDLRQAQQRGWIDPSQDVTSFVVLHWTLVLGQSVFWHPLFGPLTKLESRDGILHLVVRCDFRGDPLAVPLRMTPEEFQTVTSPSELV